MNVGNLVKIQMFLVMEISVFVFMITCCHKMKYWWPHLHQTNKELGARGFNLQGFGTAGVMNDTLAKPALVAFSPPSLLLWPQVLQKPVCFQFRCSSVQKD